MAPINCGLFKFKPCLEFYSSGMSVYMYMCFEILIAFGEREGRKEGER